MVYGKYPTDWYSNSSVCVYILQEEYKNMYKHGDFSIRNNKIVKLFFKKLLTFSKSFL